jgi:UDP-2,3-diacylglucosamine pyrophosphatase LpxH
MPKEYYFISDLHIGGDEALGVCDFENELIQFLHDIPSQSEEAELIIIGDAFGLWEFTQVEGKEKLEALFAQFPKIFEAFRNAGKKIEITLLPGNHDYEIACYKEFVDLFKAFNIRVEQVQSITRKIGQKLLWIEHGNQYDEANRMPDFGNPHAMPVGYFITKNTVGKAGILSEKGRQNWMKNIQSVYPTELIPDWMMSNYFYHEMSPLLRWLLLPFLLLSGLTLFVLGGSGLEYFELTSTNIFLDNRIFNSLGIVGSLFQYILMTNAILLLTTLVLAVPIGLIFRDLKRTLIRFGIELDPASLTGEKEEQYLNAAQNVFRENNNIIAFIYGHTHKPSMQEIDGRYIVNTGTWLKQFERIKPLFGFLPTIYKPFFCLNYFKITEKDKSIAIDYVKIDKNSDIDLSLLQRFLVLGRRRIKKEFISGK